MARDFDAARLSHFMRKVDRVKLPWALEDLGSLPSSAADLEEVCSVKLGPGCPSIAVSTLYVDKNDKPVFAYFATRLKDAEASQLAEYNQYQGRTVADVSEWTKKGKEVIMDGLEVCLWVFSWFELVIIEIRLFLP